MGDKYYMVSIVGRKEISKNISMQILWHNCYKYISGPNTKESILGQAVSDFIRDHAGAILTMVLIDPTEINKGGIDENRMSIL